MQDGPWLHAGVSQHQDALRGDGELHEGGAAAVLTVRDGKSATSGWWIQGTQSSPDHRQEDLRQRGRQSRSLPPLGHDLRKLLEVAGLLEQGDSA